MTQTCSNHLDSSSRMRLSIYSMTAIERTNKLLKVGWPKYTVAPTPEYEKDNMLEST